MIRSERRSVFPLVLAALLAGCGDGPAGTGETPPSSVTVNVGNVFFQSVRNGSMDPATDTVAIGGTVSWTWTELGTHGVRFDDPAFPESPEITESGSVYSVVFPAADSYTYNCSIHGSVMFGTIVVK